MSKNLIIVEWLHGEQGIVLEQHNNNGVMPESIHFYYAEKHIIQPIQILLKKQKRIQSQQKNGGINNVEVFL